MFNILAREVRRNKIGGANIGALIFLLYVGPLAAFAHNFKPIFFKNIFSFYSPNKALNKYFLNKYLSAMLNVIGFFKRQYWELYNAIKIPIKRKHF